MRKKRPDYSVNPWIFLGVLLIISATALLSCATGPAAPGSSKGKPAWIYQYPTDTRYFIGIGSSSTGNQAQDMEAARAKALTSLASSISTVIQSEQTVVATASSQGPAAESVELIIRETVNQNLSNIEVADSYYSSRDGYWIYLRLDRALWREIQEREMRDLVRRIEEMVNPVINNASETAASRLGAVLRALGIASESPYALSVRVTLGGESAGPIDLLQKLALSYFEGISLSFSPAQIKYEEGSTVPVSLRAVSSRIARAGSFPIVVTDASGREVLAFVTGEDGRYQGNAACPELAIGRTDLTARINLSALAPGYKPDSRMAVPEARFYVEKSPIKVTFSYVGRDQYLGQDVEGSVRALVSRHLPAKLAEPGETSRYGVRFEIHLRDAPDTGTGLFINYAKAIVSVLHDGKPVWTYESEEVKTGGLNWNQGRATAVKKLIEVLDADKGFIEGLSKAIVRN